VELEVFAFSAVCGSRVGRSVLDFRSWTLTWQFSARAWIGGSATSSSAHGEVPRWGQIPNLGSNDHVGRHILTHTHTHTHNDTDTQTHRHTDTQTHRHTDTQTARRHVTKYSTSQHNATQHTPHTPHRIDTNTHTHTQTHTHTHDIGHPTPDTRHQTSDTKHQTPDTKQHHRKL
jgi:hypothetical protein